jgi:flagellar motor switch protein FliG
LIDLLQNTGHLWVARECHWCGEREALVRAMPQRQVAAFEEMVRRAPAVPVSRVEEARREIMDQLRELAAEGEITLQLLAEDVV